jgi:putative ABC transport system permease protein
MVQGREVLSEAYGAMKHNRRRTALTMLGMAWGIATVVLLLAYGAGFSNAIISIFQTFGMKVIGVWGGRTSLEAGGTKAGTTIRLTRDDLERLTVNVPQITHISPEVYYTTLVSYEGRGYTWGIRGGHPSIQQIQRLELDQGRFYTADDLQQKAHVCILGSEAKDKLFSGRRAVGERIRIKGIPFDVIGVAKAKPQEGEDNDNNRLIYIPLTAMGDLRSIFYVDGFWLDYEGENFGGIEKSVRATLATQHNFKPEDKRAIFVFNSMEQLSQFRIISIALQVLLAFIGTLTLGIGGVGLMNIMLVSVTQRTREIGVEKALGASRRDILLQFLSEALAITFVGGLLGIILAYGVAYSVGTLTLYSAIAKHGEVGDIRLMISPLSVFIATGILTLVGLVSGMIPAIRASRLDPIEALRYE